jgi:acyl-CoA-binding protein
MRTLSMRIVSYLNEYLGEFELIFKTILDYESGDQMGSFDAKNRHQKFHAWASLRDFLAVSIQKSYVMYMTQTLVEG